MHGGSKTRKTGIRSNKVKKTIAKLIKRVTSKSDVQVKVTPKTEARKKVILKDRSVVDSSRSGEPSEGYVVQEFPSVAQRVRNREPAFDTDARGSRIQCDYTHR